MQRVFVVLFIHATRIFAQVLRDDCCSSAGYVYDPAIGTCFKYESNKATWNQAESQCHMMGGHLISIHNSPANEALFRSVYDLTFIGLHYDHQFSNFSWSDGTDFDYANNIDVSGGGTPGEDCLVLNITDSRHAWAPEFCNNRHAFICSVPAKDPLPTSCSSQTPAHDPGNVTAVTEPISHAGSHKAGTQTTTSQPTGVCPIGWMQGYALPNKCYYYLETYLDYFGTGRTCTSLNAKATMLSVGQAFENSEVRDRKNFNEAEAECQTSGGHLVAIHSNASNEAVFKKVGTAISFIGLRYNHEIENFTWSDGSEFNYTNNVGNESDPDGDCLILNVSGQLHLWTSEICDNRYSFSCTSPVRDCSSPTPIHDPGNVTAVPDTIPTANSRSTTVNEGNRSTSFLVITTTKTPSPICPDGWMQGNTLPNKCYFYLEDRLDYFGTGRACTLQHVNSTMVAIRQAFENSEIRAMMELDPTIWIGLDNRSANWTWANGEEFTFRNWAVGEPKSADESDSLCARIDKTSGKWFATACYDRFSAICQMYT